MTQSSSTAFWQQETLKYDRPHPRLKAMAKLVRSLPERCVLDIGCSTAQLRHLLPDDFDYFGCDASDYARQVLPEGHFLQQDFCQSADLAYFQGRGIDLIHIGGVLEYLPHPDTLLQAARALVSPMGRLVLSYVNFENPKYCQSLGHSHWVFKTPLDRLRGMLGECGWRVEKVIPFLDRSGLFALFHRWRALRLGPDHPWVRRTARQFILQARAD
ncbi:MAG: class I SAM-dependent methyltransferase [Gemmataceae bacterium]|nr:class I SAM-dependent methyltransferase [Gemmataceae bacterium]MCI0742852.1 class I SAM-dependent methyltransferase [Gemmataceae bacterium]